MRSVYKDFEEFKQNLPSDSNELKKAIWEFYDRKCVYSEERIGLENIEFYHYTSERVTEEIGINDIQNILPISKKLSESVNNLQHLSVKKINSEDKPLHPLLDRPEKHFVFNSDGTVQPITRKSSFTITLFSLNDGELIKNRLEKISEIRSKLQAISDTLDIGKNSSELEEAVFSVFKKIELNSSKDQEFSLLYLNIRSQFNYFLGPNDYQEGFNYILNELYRKYFFPAMIKLEDNSEKEYSSFNEVPGRMPYALISHRVENFQRIKELEIKNLPANTQWIFLTGENGHGKTSVLQSIALGMYGLKGNNLKEDYSESYFQSVFLDKDGFLENFVGMEFGFRQISHFAAYGTDRLSLSETFHLNSDKSRLNSLFGFRQEGLQNIEEYLISLNKKNKDKFDVIVSVFKTLISGLDDIIIDDRSTKDKVYYIEKDSENRPMKQIEFSQLATGYKNIIAMIGDMIIQLGDQADVLQIDGADTLDIPGIVIIDEIDAHLHPKYQKNFVSTLTKLFPKVQFIASTHSPIPLLGAPYNTVILNVSRESAKEGIKVERLDDKLDFRTLTPQVLLTSPIFGFDEIIPDSIPNLRELRTEENYNEVIFSKILEQKLNEIDSAAIEKMEKMFE